MKKIPDIINRLWNVCGQMEVGALLTWGSGIMFLILDPDLECHLLTFFRLLVVFCHILSTTLLLLLFAGTIFCEFLRFGKNRKNKYPQKLLPTYLALWYMYYHKLRDVCHFGTCIIILL